MAWIESHQELERHYKTQELMNLMNWDLDTTIGKLHRFWWWCVDYAENGDLRKHNDSRLAMAVGLNGELGQQFVESMVQSGWIDREPYFRVHDWWEYIGLFLQRKYGEKKKEKWQAIQLLYNNCTPIDATNLTKPNQTKPTYNVHFDELWAQYPKKLGKNSAERHFRASVKTQADYENIQKALVNFSDSRVCKGDPKYIPHGSTWFHNWRDWVDYQEPVTEQTKVDEEAEIMLKAGVR